MRLPLQTGTFKRTNPPEAPMNRYVSLLLLLLLMPTVAAAQKYRAADGRLNVALVVNPYGGDRADSETSLALRLGVIRPTSPMRSSLRSLHAVTTPRTAKSWASS